MQPIRSLDGNGGIAGPTGSPWRTRRFWLGAAVSLLFLAIFFYRVDLAEMVGAVARANYLYTLPAIVVYFVGVWFRTLRWHYLLRPVKRIGARELFPVVAIGYMVNNILPARVGELARAYLMGNKEGVSKVSVLATITIERMFDGLVLLLFMVVVWAFIPLDPWLQQILRLGTLFFVGFLVVFLIVASSPDRARVLVGLFLRPLPARLRPRVEELAEQFIAGLAALRSPSTLVAVLLTSILAWLAEATMYYLITFSFSIGQSFGVLILMTSVANLGTTFPSGPGGLGTFDALSRWSLTLFGVGADEAAAYTVVLHAVLWLPITLVGLFYLWRENLSLASVQGLAAGTGAKRPGPAEQ